MGLRDQKLLVAPVATGPTLAQLFCLRIVFMWTISKSLLNLLQNCLCCMCFGFFDHKACESPAPQPGIKHTHLHWKVKSQRLDCQGKSRGLAVNMWAPQFPHL